MASRMNEIKRIGIITAGGDSPGLNAAIRGVGKAALGGEMEIVAFRDGYRGLAEDLRMRLGTSRDKPHRMEIGGEMRDMTDAIAATYKRHKLHALVCIGGGGTHKN